MQYNDQTEDENDLHNTTETTPEKWFDEHLLAETDININFIIPDEDLEYTVIDDRFVIGDVIATGHVATVRMGIVFLNFRL